MIARFAPYLILIAVILGALWYASSQAERAVTAEARNVALTGLVEDMNAEIANQRIKLADRERARVLAAQSASLWQRKWKEAQHEPEVKDWADTPLPAAVRERVRDITGHPGGVPDERAPVIPNPPTDVQ